MTSPQNGIDSLEVVAAFGTAWGNHDLEATLAMITEDCLFDDTDPAPDGKAYKGRAAIALAWAPIFADLSSRFEAEDTFAMGERVVQLWRYSWTGGHVRGVDVFRVTNGKVSEKLSYVKG